MTTNSITYYPTLIKSYLVDKAKNSVFNTPIVRTAFVASTVVFTGITTAYFIKKINDTVRVALNRPLEAACIAAAIVSTGVVIAYYPVWTMILFVGISFILLNRQAYAKMQEINKVFQDFFINSPFIKKIQISFGANPKLVDDSNSASSTAGSSNELPITHAIQLLNLKELQFRVAQSDEISSSDPIIPSIVITEAEEVPSEDVAVDNMQIAEENNTASDTALSVVATLVEEVAPEDQSVDNLQLFEENDIADNTILPIVPTEIESVEEVLSDEKDDIAPVAPTHTESVEQVASEENDAVAPLPLGLVDQCKLMNLSFKNVQTDSRNSAGNSSLLGIAKTINQFNIDGITLEKINLAGLDQQGDELADSSSITLPIKPVTFPSAGTWSNRNLLEKPVKPILINPLMPKSGISANKMIKTTGTLLNLLKRVPK